jgi:hypothetical protein
MKSSDSSTERVRRYRQRQRAGDRKLVRIYLPGDVVEKLEQLATARGSGGGYAERLLACAIEKAWSQRVVVAGADGPATGRGTADDAFRSLFPGRRRGVAG